MCGQPPTFESQERFIDAIVEAFKHWLDGGKEVALENDSPEETYEGPEDAFKQFVQDLDMITEDDRIVDGCKEAYKEFMKKQAVDINQKIGE